MKTILLALAACIALSATPAFLIHGDGQNHTLAGLRGDLIVYADEYGPNELVTLRSIIHTDPQPDHGRDCRGHQNPDRLECILPGTGGGRGNGGPGAIATPEPSAGVLVAGGLVCVFFGRFRRR